MPFDLSPVEISPLDRLIRELRGPVPEWWYFGSCSTCAIETARLTLNLPRIESLLGEFGEKKYDRIKTVFEILGIPPRDAEEIFLPVLAPHVSYKAVLPIHVAVALRFYRRYGRAISPFTVVGRRRARA